MTLYRSLYRHVLGRVDPETAHRLAALALRIVLAPPAVRGLVRRILTRGGAGLRVTALGRTFDSPLGAAAGMDKDAAWFDQLGALGFGFVEVGTLTAAGQPGNPRPRIHRLPRRRALHNSMGFPNRGAEEAARRLRHRDRSTIVGVNVGKTKAAAAEATVDDYRVSVGVLAPLADYLVLNVSSPNTPGVRDMQAVDRFVALAEAVKRDLGELGGSVPLLVKIGPDLADDAIDAVADAARRLGLDGIIATNTTVDWQRHVASGDLPASAGHGGISGGPLRERALAVLERLHARVGGELTLIAAGGIETPRDAFERILAGASLVQAYTGFVYGGPLWPRRMNAGLARLVRAAGATSVQELVGAGAGRGSLQGHPAERSRPDAAPVASGT